MPLFGKKKEAPLPFQKPTIMQYRDYLTPGATTGLAFCEIEGEDALVMSSLNSRGFSTVSVDGKKLWTFDTGATVYSLAVGNFSGQTVILAGSGGKVFAVSEKGQQLWQYDMPVKKDKPLWMKGVMKLAVFAQEVNKQYGLDDVYHIATGKLDGKDVAVAIAGMPRNFEGPQVLSGNGEHLLSLKKKYWTGEFGLPVIKCLLDLSPRGDTLLAILAGSTSEARHLFKEVSVISSEGKVVKKLKAKMDFAPKNRYTEGGIQDKERGKLVAGKLDGIDAVVFGAPETRSVAAVSLEGAQLWKYVTAEKGLLGMGTLNSGVNDIALGSLNGHSIVVIGTFDGVIHIVSGNGTRMEAWGYKSNVTNVACGKIKGKDAMAVGLYNGQVITYAVQ
jgi:hypothetical protein